jgi:hypothetical protein
MGGINIGIALDPYYIFNWAQRSSFNYPATAEQELLIGWGTVSVFPELWSYLTREQGHGDFPPLDKMVDLLLSLATPGKANLIMLKHRAEKLVMDFARDVHAYALLIHSGHFATVSYQRIEDLRYNVDFVTRPKGYGDRVGIQTAMRMRWASDIWEQIKKTRREQWGASEWDRPIFWMTNRNIPARKLPNRLWLFSEEHVEEIVSQILGDKSKELEKKYEKKQQQQRQEQLPF